MLKKEEMRKKKKAEDQRQRRKREKEINNKKRDSSVRYRVYNRDPKIKAVEQRLFRQAQRAKKRK